MRDAGQEVSLYRGALPQATSVSLAAQLLGKMTSATRAAIRAEQKLFVQEALNQCGVSRLVYRELRMAGVTPTALAQDSS